MAVFVYDILIQIEVEKVVVVVKVVKS